MALFITISLTLLVLLWAIWGIYSLLTAEPLHYKQEVKNKKKKKSEWREGRRGEDNKCYWVNTHNTNYCPFCRCTKIFSGSWAPETCTRCGAGFMMGTWIKEKRNVQS